MRALVTGASGFLGSRLARLLAGRGYDVRVLLRPTADRSRLHDFPYEVAEGDVTDHGSVLDAVRDVDAVFHSAALYEMGPSDPARLDRVNVEGAGNVFEAAARRGVPVVHVSSVTALGPTGIAPEDESWWNDATPGSHYERTKREAHLLARSFRSDGADVRVGIPGGIYGPGDTSMLGALTRVFMTAPAMVGFLPDVIQSTVYVDDCADGLVRILEDGGPGDEFVLCAESVTMREWQDAITAAAGRRRPLVYVPSALVRWTGPLATRVSASLAEYAETALRSWSFSGEKARSVLGWTPRPLDHGLACVAASFGRPDRRG